MNDHKDANQIIKEIKQPNEVYKHILFDEYLLKTLKNAEILFLYPMSFNDPYDCQTDDQTDWFPEIIYKYLPEIGNNNGYKHLKFKKVKITPNSYSIEITDMHSI